MYIFYRASKAKKLICFLQHSNFGNLKLDMLQGTTMSLPNSSKKSVTRQQVKCPNVLQYENKKRNTKVLSMTSQSKRALKRLQLIARSLLSDSAFSKQCSMWK